MNAILCRLENHLILIALLLVIPTITIGQTKSPSSPVITPSMKTEDLLQIRNLQYEQDKRLIELLKLEARYKEVQQAIAAADQQIETAIRAGARMVNVNVEKDYVFDLDTLKFVPRPQQPQAVKPTQTSPPEAKPNAKL